MLPGLMFYRSLLPGLLAVAALLIALEALWAFARKDAVYHGVQLRSDLACAALRVPAELMFNAAFLYVYQKLQLLLDTRVLDLASVATPLLSFLSYEFVFYWAHRLSHSVALLWAVHAVHHQSRDFNFASGMRLGVLAPLLNYPFFLSLAIVGIPVEGYLLALYVSGSWQFLLHSQGLARTGLHLGWLLNVPCHHIEHHSPDRDASHCNFASVLTVLDRVFRTYRRGNAAYRHAPAVRRAPLGPARANIEPWLQLWRRRRAPSTVSDGGALLTRGD